MRDIDLLQAFLNYGSRRNDDFLLHYGFVPADNAHDDVVLFADLGTALGVVPRPLPAAGRSSNTVETDSSIA